MNLDEETETLTQRMAKQTKNVHDKSDRLVNLKLAMILTSRELYAEAISLFWPIYRELERLMEQHQSDDRLGLLYPLLPTLRRASKFERDMEFMVGESGVPISELKNRRINKKVIVSSDNGQEAEEETFSPPELQAYIDNLRRIAEENPVVLVAYISAMYGAIMAGGSIIQRMVKRAFSLKSKEGVTMFDMDLANTSKFPNSKALRNEIKRIIDHDMNISPQEQDMILKEAPMVFVHNNTLVATAKDTPAFSRAWDKGKQYVLLGLVVPILLSGLTYAVYFSRR